MSTNLNYRKDNRTVKQFKKDIKDATNIEREIVCLYVRYSLITKGIAPQIIDNGCDNSGKLIKKKVKATADYLFNNVPVEIKYSNEKRKSYHFKTYQIKSYIQQKAYILLVNGYETNNPLFTILTPKDLKHIIKLSPIKVKAWGNKKAYEVKLKKYKWESLII
jgi:hypothetical protein